MKKRPPTLAEIERKVILDRIKFYGGNRTVTSEVCGVAVTTIRKKIVEYRAQGYFVPIGPARMHKKKTAREYHHEANQRAKEDKQKEKVKMDLKKVNKYFTSMFTHQWEDPRHETKWYEAASKPPFTDKYRFKYTITKTRGSKSNTIIYYFHGALGTEYSWTEGISADANEKIHKGLLPDVPTIVTISWSSCYLLDEDRLGAIWPVLDEIDKRLGYNPAKHTKMAFGVSMGGFNAIQVAKAKRRFSEELSAIIIVAPLMPLVGPFASFLRRFFQYVRRRYRGCRFGASEAVAFCVRWFYSKDEWKRHAPIDIKKLPPAMFIVGEKDVFGFYKSIEKIVDELDSFRLVITHPKGHTVECVDAIINRIKIEEGSAHATSKTIH